jgi:hypothetical protein
MNTTNEIWAGPDDSVGHDDVRFVALIEHEIDGGGGHYQLSDHPFCGNQSHAPRLRGWCGSTNNVSTMALGMGQVMEILKNGRVRVELLEGEREIDALGRMGYPELGGASP